ncbi:MAG: flagellar motor protein MotB [Sulfuricurvum sp.]|uniref:flagellar motor protein MotB n=1 Tax=Sulfuricurvum sp. TaxID=2025608 RepID=UPI0026383C69|nr:flagellar motor protein MotB [Sulfuricurvum sp.]MDD5159628.1 flagellar motor protein MotB [Sulfuricurvum sp.]
MGKKCKKCPECPPAEKWAVPTADFFSLLLALFIALYAIASVNKEKLRAVKEEFVKIYDYAPAPETTSPVVPMEAEVKPVPNASANPAGQMPVAEGGSLLTGEPMVQQTVEKMLSKLEQDMGDQTGSGAGPLDETVDGVLLKLPVSVSFRGSDATIDDEEKHMFIRRIAEIINTLPASVDISVRGYTDNAKLPVGSRFQDNLELSSARAANVVRELIRNGVKAERLSSAGFGESNPIASNAIEEQRVKNRRVEFYMFVSDKKAVEPQKQQTVLDALGKIKKPQ